MKKPKKQRFSLFKSKWDGNPRFEAVRFVAIYLIISLLWIVGSDKILELLVSDVALLTTLQIVKGWFFVVTSGVLFFFILKTRYAMIHALTKEMVHQATHDRLTKIPTKEEFARRLHTKISKDNENNHFALVRLDVDNFSNINELLDYTIGDQLLVDLKDAIVQIISSNELIGRDGDGFVFTITYYSKKADAIKQTLDEIIAKINSIWIIDKHEIYMTCSMGVALFPKDGLTFLQLYKAADIVMNHVKENDKNNYIFFDEDYILRRFDKINMINELRKAIDNHDLYLMYQPIFTMDDQTICGFEALLRWESQVYGKVSPAQFIQHSENIGLILEIEEWVFDKAMQLRKTWNDMHDTTTVLSINLSSKGLSSPAFIANIKSLYNKYNIQKGQIQIEVTETSMIKNIAVATTHLNMLQELGCIVALDDFGSGYSSLTYLQKLPISILKVDSRFTHKIGTDKKDDLILQSIIDLARKLDIKTIVEGIETSHQFDTLVQLQCDYGQGYYLSIPIEEVKMMQHITKMGNLRNK